MRKVLEDRSGENPEKKAQEDRMVKIYRKENQRQRGHSVLKVFQADDWRSKKI